MSKQSSCPRIGQAYITKHPEGYIRLMDNSLLKVYETLEPHKGFEQEQIGEVFDFFQEHLPLFWKHRHLILSDSRMFLAPIPSVSGLAYSGRFPDTTLGVYLEFWSICQPATQQDDKGVRSFVTVVAGSPLSGCNRCTLVNEKGRITRNVELNSFSQVWSEFANLVGRYQGIEKVHSSYSLEEVAQRLQSPHKEPQEICAVLSTSERYDAVRTAYEHKALLRKWEYLQEQYTQAIDLLHRYVVEAHREELTKIYQEHIRLQEEWTKREPELIEERRAIRHRLRHSEPNNRELQLRLKAIRHEKEEWLRRLGGEYREQIRQIFLQFPLPCHRLGELLGLK